MAADKMKAAVIGLGNIGFRFSLDPSRKGTWSHVAAYERSGVAELVGAVETDEEAVRLFKSRNKDTRVFATVEAMMRNCRPDIVSICTPTATHRRMLKQVAAYPVKAVFCEKPLDLTVAGARKMVRLCRRKKIILAVNHTRRWDANYIFVSDAIRKGKIGKPVAVSAHYCGGIFNIGTHLFDSLRMVTGGEAAAVSGLCAGKISSDPDISGWIRFKDGVFCSVIATGRRKDLIFEIDVIGSEGRIKISENGKKVELFSFKKSRRYSGYRELSAAPVGNIRGRDRFIEAIRDICAVIKKKKARVSCSAEDGFEALAISHAFLRSAKQNGKPISLSYWRER